MIYNGAALTLTSESDSETQTYQEKNQQSPLEKAAPDFRGLKRWSSNRTYTTLNLRQGTNVQTGERRTGKTDGTSNEEWCNGVAEKSSPRITLIK